VNSLCRRNNINKLLELLEKTGLNSIIILSPENIEYFLGIETIADAWLMLHVNRETGLELYVPLLDYYRYRDQLEGKDIEVYGVSKKLEAGDARIVRKEWSEILKNIIGRWGKIGVDSSHASPASIILKNIPREKIVDVSKHIDGYRMVKEDWEIDSIVNAIEITGRGIYKVIESLTHNITELELAGIFEYSVRKEGVREYAFSPLILFKPGNSYPHNLPSTTQLSDSDLVLVDVGVKYGGRCSDITRMAIWGSISEEEKRVIEVVEEALGEAIDTIQPGVKASDVDRAARKVIERAGLGEKFIHGLGHGLGVVVHEAPAIRAGSDVELKPGMVFTVEPGVYVAGKYGVRIEENVVVTKSGSRILSRDIDRVFT